MSGGREATSEQSSSVREGAGYDEVYPSRHEPKEDLSWSPAREPSTHSLAKGKRAAMRRRKEISKGRKEIRRREDIMKKEMRVTGGVNNMTKGQ